MNNQEIMDVDFKTECILISKGEIDLMNFDLVHWVEKRRSDMVDPRFPNQYIVKNLYNETFGLMEEAFLLKISKEWIQGKTYQDIQKFAKDKLAEEFI